MDEQKHEDFDLGHELRELGRQLQEALRVAREHPQTKEFERQVSQAVRELSTQIEQTLRSTRENERVRQAQAQVKQTAEALKESHATDDIQHGLAKGIKALNEQIARAIAEAEKGKRE